MTKIATQVTQKKVKMRRIWNLQAFLWRIYLLNTMLFCSQAAASNQNGMKKVGQINNVLKQCSKLVAFVRKSTIATDLLEGENRLQIDNATRWNSQLKLIRSASFRCWKMLRPLLPCQKYPQGYCIYSIRRGDRYCADKLFPICWVYSPLCNRIAISHE